MDNTGNERISMNLKFRSRLREMLDETGSSQASLARAAGVSPAVISKYLNDVDKEPLFYIVAKIARHFDVSPEWLGGMSDERTPFQKGTITDIYYRLSTAGKTELYNYGQYLLTKEQQLSEETAIYELPLKGTTAAGQPIEYGDPIYETVPVKLIPKSADFALCVAGDSMEPLIKDGSVVFVKDQTVAENGEIIIVEVDGAVTCKKFHKQDGIIELRSINPKYKPITKFETIRIIGKVIM